MKLLIITQKVNKNDPILGFFHGWIYEFSKHAEKLTVICLEKGEYDLPENVKVFSLGKEEGIGKVGRLFRFYKYIWKYRKEYNYVFVHMNQIYVILGGLFWRIFGKKVGFWYAHGHVSFSLRVAEKLADKIFTSTAQGFRLKSKKINIVGQGIDTDFFKPVVNRIDREELVVATVGRISPSKDYVTIINSISKTNKRVSLRIIGYPITISDEKYLRDLEDLIKDKNLSECVKFVGSLSNTEVLEELQQADIFINAGKTGSLDKAVLEAMSAGIPVLSSNESVVSILNKNRQLTFEGLDSERLTELIENLSNIGLEGRIKIGESLREIVVRDHGLNNLIKKIISKYVF